ncbi:MAG: hypothetical protein FWC22_01895 [Treponema sp.]|nr:hypothetical protein [Treponema sp.]
MRFFIFPLENIYIAVAADKIKCFVSSDILNSSRDNDPSGNDQIKIPVYMIFGKQHCAENASCHGIILKQETDAMCGGNKTLVIVTPPVERDFYIEEKEIQSFPGTFSGVYYLFSGLYFNEQNIILFLDVEKLISHWLKRLEDELPGYRDD